MCGGLAPPHVFSPGTVRPGRNFSLSLQRHSAPYTGQPHFYIRLGGKGTRQPLHLGDQHRWLRGTVGRCRHTRRGHAPKEEEAQPRPLLHTLPGNAHRRWRSRLCGAPEARRRGLSWRDPHAEGLLSAQLQREGHGGYGEPEEPTGGDTCLLWTPVADTAGTACPALARLADAMRLLPHQTLRVIEEERHPQGTTARTDVEPSAKRVSSVSMNGLGPDRQRRGGRERTSSPPPPPARRRRVAGHACLWPAWPLNVLVAAPFSLCRSIHGGSHRVRCIFRPGHHLFQPMGRRLSGDGLARGVYSTALLQRLADCPGWLLSERRGAFGAH